MVWLLERNAEQLICKIRHLPDGTSYEFEIGPVEGQPKTEHFSSASELIDEYLRHQATLLAQGWRPRLDDGLTES